MTEGLPTVRVDKWLWAARFFKTRGAATEACEAGHVKLNGVSVKPSKGVRPGDSLEAVTPGGLKVALVTGLAEKRGSASIARELYVDHSPPPPPKEAYTDSGRRERGAGRPTKRDRRLLTRLRS